MQKIEKFDTKNFKYPQESEENFEVKREEENVIADNVSLEVYNELLSEDHRFKGMLEFKNGKVLDFKFILLNS